jgi:hypothetical protein
MADIDAGAGALEPKRYTFLAVLAMLGASLAALAIGAGGTGLYVPTMMTAAGVNTTGEPLTWVYYTIMALMLGGPVAGGLGFVAGWAAFTVFKAPWTGVRLAFFIPVIWLVALLAWLAFVSVAPLCDGSLTCGL